MNGPEGRVVTTPGCAGSFEKKVIVILTTASWVFTEPSGSVVTIVVTVPASCSYTGKPQTLLVCGRRYVSSVVFVTNVGWLPAPWLAVAAKPSTARPVMVGRG